MNRTIADVWMRRAMDAERTLALVVFAAGGGVDVYPNHVEHAHDLVLERREDHVSRAIEFRAKRKTA